MCPFQMAPCPFENLGRTLESKYIFDSLAEFLRQLVIDLFEQHLHSAASTLVSVMTATSRNGDKKNGESLHWLSLF